MVRRSRCSSRENSPDRFTHDVAIEDAFLLRPGNVRAVSTSFDGYWWILMHITGNNFWWWNRGNGPDYFGNGHGVSPDFHDNRNATTGLGFDYRWHPTGVKRLVRRVLLKVVNMGQRVAPFRPDVSGGIRLSPY